MTLVDNDQPIWRQVQVASNISLYRLHRIIQVVMGWTNSHLYQFTVADRIYGNPDPEFELDITEARRVKLTDVAPRRGSKFIYEYDFGDGWEHQLVVEAILPADPGVRYPVCLAGSRACPPEDCGGVSGYEELLEVLADPKHEEHKHMMQWVGGEFDPELFDLEAVNRRLRRLR